jgi:hypothetical protein
MASASFHRMFRSRRHLVCLNCTKVGAIFATAHAIDSTNILTASGAILTVDSTAAELKAYTRFPGMNALSLEVRVRSHLPARCTQPTLSRGGGREQVLEAVSGGSGRLTVPLPAETSTIVLKKWTKGVDAVVSVHFLDNGKNAGQCSSCG